MRVLLASLTLIALFAAAGCGEREQVADFKRGKYQGKPDTPSWNNAPLAYDDSTSKWTQGDRTSWETQIKNRQLGQHEHKRIYQ